MSITLSKNSYLGLFLQQPLLPYELGLPSGPFPVVSILQALLVLEAAVYSLQNQQTHTP